MSGMPDVRELSFQNVIDTILKPAGVKVGGYPDEIFQDLTDDEKDKWICNVCYLIVREARQCDNKHMFCRTCVFAWSMTYGENSQKCPMCRNSQPEYHPVKDFDKQLGERAVKCPQSECAFQAPLRVYLMHSHGRQQFTNERNDLENLRPARPSGARLIVLGDLNGGQRVTQLRDQLQQGRMMLHQMMLLLHLEMQLRQQAMVSYTQVREPAAREPGTRVQRLDEVVALNEQLNEVGGILSALLTVPTERNRNSSTPVSRSGNTGIMSSLVGAPSTSANRTTTNRTSPPPSLRGPISSIRFQSLRDEEEDDEDEESSTSSDSTVVMSRNRYGMSGQNNFSSSRNIGTSTRSNALSHSQSSSIRPQRRSDIRQQLYSDIESTDNSGAGTSGGNPGASSRLLQRSTSRDEPSHNTGATTSRAATNNTSLTSVQRISPRGATTGRTVSRERSTSLPPINSSPVTTPRSVPNANSESTSTRVSRRIRPSEVSPPTPVRERETTSRESTDGSRIPHGSSAHQRLIREMTTAAPSRQSLSQSETATVTVTQSSRPQISTNSNVSNQTQTRTSSIAPQVSNGQLRPLGREAGAGTARPNSVARHRLPPEAIPQPLTSSGEPSQTAGDVSRPNEPSQRRASDETSRTTYAPQRRFRRESTSVENSQTSQARTTGTGRRPSITSQSQPARDTRNRVVVRAATRRGSLSQDNGSSQEQDPSTSESSQPRTSESSPTRNTPANRRRSRNAGRPNGTQNTNGGLPNTAGQLIRARRRSEIQNEIRNFTRNQEDND